MEKQELYDILVCTLFPKDITDHFTIVHVEPRWIDKTTGKSVGNRYSLTANGTRHSKEFAAFLKGIFGQVPDSGTES